MKEAVVDRPKERIWTYEDYLSGRIPEEVSEVIRGKEVRKMPAGDIHGFMEAFITGLLLKPKEPYIVLSGEVALLLSRSPLTLRGADVVAISRDRWKLKGGAIEVPPDLIVEIVSPSDSLPYIIEKMEDYRRWGVKRQVWVFPEDREVVVVDEGGVRAFGEGDEVELLEGVKFRLKDLLKEVEDEGRDS